MGQYASSHGERIEKVLALNGEESSALASLLYSIAVGENAVTLAPNHREALMKMYADAYQFGNRIDLAGGVVYPNAAKVRRVVEGFTRQRRSQ